MSADRINWVRIEGFRSIEDLTIHLDGLLVLIGENGTGKSTIVEAFELLRKAATERDFTTEVARRHGSGPELLRVGAKKLRLTVGFVLEGDSKDWEYVLALSASESSPTPGIVEESLEPFFSRDSEKATFLTSTGEPGKIQVRFDKLSPADTAILSLWGVDLPEPVARLQRLLRALRVQLPFDTRPSWGRSDAQRAGPRTVGPLESGRVLDSCGGNLASAFQHLKNRPNPGVWSEVMLDVRAGLGSDVRDLVIEVPMVGVSILKVVINGLGLIPVSQLSEGQLSYLLIVALAHLNEPSSVLMFDEPELHLHPGLLVRATWLFERMSKQFPVILSTHADALLDSLNSATDSVRVLELDEKRRTQMRRLSQDRLTVWRDQFATLSEIRREGLLHDVVESTQ